MHDHSSPAGTPWVWKGHERLALKVGPVDFVPPPSLPRIEDPVASVHAALARPLGTPRLQELARGAEAVVIAVPDGSRKLPTDVIVPALLDELDAAGVAAAAVTVTVGCGAHRTTTDDERLLLAGGRAVAARGVRLTDSQAFVGRHTTLGTTDDGCPVSLSADVAEADLVVGVGVVEPHLYAGYSGGVKSVAIGCAGAETIAWTHAPPFISRTGVEVLRLVGNPFQETLGRIATATRLRFAVNLAVDADGAPVAVAAGTPLEAQRAVADRCTPAWSHLVEHPYDAIVAGVPAPKHESLYQASRAATYLALSDRSPLSPGGLIVLCSDLPRGVGDGPGERRFGRLLAEASPDELIVRGLRGPLGAGGQRAFVVARVRQRFRLAVAGSGDPAALADTGIGRYDTPDEALRSAAGGRVLVVADAMASIVRLADDPNAP